MKATSAVLALMADAEHGTRMAEAGLPEDRHDPEAHRGQDGAGRAGAGACPAAGRRSTSSVVPATMTMVPARMGRVTRSPSSSTARPVETSGFRLISAAEIEAPTFSMLTKRRRRPPGGADEAGEREEREAPRGEAAEALGEEHGDPEARRAHHEVDPEARERVCCAAGPGG